MAELSLICPSTTSSVSTTSGVVNIKKRVLVRTAGLLPRNTPIDILSPGPGWVTVGSPTPFSDAIEFDTKIQIFLNGNIMFTAQDATANNDVYFVAPSGQLAFEINIDTNDLIQIWKFGTTVS